MADEPTLADWTISYGAHHVTGRCRDCDWLDEDYQTARRTTQAHVLETGHTAVLQEEGTMRRIPMAEAVARVVGNS